MSFNIFNLVKLKYRFTISLLNEVMKLIQGNEKFGKFL